MTLSKQQFMLKQASREWNSTRYFTRVGILEELKLPVSYRKLRFSQIPVKAQRQLSKFAEYQLEYGEDWQVYCQKHMLEQVK